MIMYTFFKACLQEQEKKVEQELAEKQAQINLMQIQACIQRIKKIIKQDNNYIYTSSFVGFLGLNAVSKCEASFYLLAGASSIALCFSMMSLYDREHRTLASLLPMERKEIRKVAARENIQIPRPSYLNEVLAAFEQRLVELNTQHHQLAPVRRAGF